MHALCIHFASVLGKVKHADKFLWPGIDVHALYADVILPDSGTESLCIVCNVCHNAHGMLGDKVRHATHNLTLSPAACLTKCA